MDCLDDSGSAWWGHNHVIAPQKTAILNAEFIFSVLKRMQVRILGRGPPSFQYAVADLGECWVSVCPRSYWCSRDWGISEAVQKLHYLSWEWDISRSLRQEKAAEHICIAKLLSRLVVH